MTSQIDLDQVNSGGVQTTGYIGSSSYLGSTNNPTTYIPINLAGDLLSGAPGISGQIMLTNYSAASPRWWTGNFGYLTSASAARNTVTAGMWNSGAAINGIQITMSTENITSGTVAIYGRL